MKSKHKKTKFISFIALVLLVSLLPLEDYLAMGLKKIEENNVVDKLYLARLDKNVVDNFRQGVKQARANPGTRAKTVEFFMGQLEATSGGQSEDTFYTFTAQTINLPESSVTVQSAYLDFTSEGGYTTLAYLSGFNLQFGQTAGACPQAVTLNNRASTTSALNSPAGAAETHVYDLRADVSADFTGYTGGSDLCAQAGYKLIFTAGTTGQVQSPSAKLVVTYTYDDTSVNQLNTVYYPLEYAADQGTKYSSSAAAAATNFSYTTTAPELTAAANLKSQFFEVNSNITVTGTTDSNSTFCRFSGSCGSATGAHYFDSAQRSGGAFRFLVDALPGYTYNDSGAALRWTNAGMAMTLQGGTNIMTYVASSSAATKTKTVRYSVGEVITAAAQATKSALTGPTVKLNEQGIAIQKAWFRLETSTGAADTLTVTTQVGANAESTADAYDAYRINMSSVDASQRDYINHIIPAADYAEIENNAAGGVTMQMAADWTTGGGSVSAELYITYTYTGEAAGWTDTRVAFAGQQITNGATTWSQANGAIDTAIPDSGGTVAIESQYLHAQEYTVNSTANEARGANLTTGACSASNSSTAEITAIAKPVALYKDTSGTVDTSDSSTYTACYSSAQAALFNGILVYTVSVSINALAVSVSGDQTASLISGATAQHLGGAGTAAFQLQVTGSGPTITSVKISDTGTVGFAGLTSPKLYYENGASCTYNGNETNVTGTYTGETVSFSLASVSIGASPNYTCMYFVFDLNGTNTAGGQTIAAEITNPSTDITISGADNTDTAAKGFATATTILPNATSTSWGTGLSDGGRSGESITISGSGFGAAQNGSQANCSGAVNTGCVRFVVGGNDTVLDADVSSWASTSITFSINSGLASYGGTAALEVVAGAQSDLTKLDFIIYPNITAVASIGTNEGRTYDSGDTDGLIMLSGDHFNSAGTVTILGSAATQHATVESRCTAGGYSSTAVCLEIPNDADYTGQIVLTRTSDSKIASTSNFRILPRLTSISPSSATDDDAITLFGNHLCQNGGSCPGAFDTNNKITFTSAVDATVFTTWTAAAASTTVPVAAASGNVVLTSNGYASNGENFTKLNNTPNNASNLKLYNNSGLTSEVAEGGISSSTPVYLTMTMETGTTGGTLYPQIEYQPIGTPFVCGAGACGSAIEGTGKAGPGPVDCGLTANSCAISISPADNVYHWQARVRHHRGSIDYYGAWASYPTPTPNSEGATDFQIDINGPGITFPNANTCSDAATTLLSNSATIGWTLSENGTGQVEYATSSDLSGSTLIPALPEAGAGSHAINLPNLDSGTTYYFQVTSVDGAGNTSQRPASSPFCSFTTLSVTDPGKTTMFYISGATGAVSSPVGTNFLVHIPEAVYDIKSAFVELTGITAGVGTNDLAVSVNDQATSTYAIAAGESFFRILYPVNGANINLDPTENVLGIDPSMSTNILSAQIYVTYSFEP